MLSSSTVTEWKAQDCGISKAANDSSMLPSKIDQMKVSQETGSETNIAFGHVLIQYLPTLDCILQRQHVSVFTDKRLNPKQ